MSTEKENTIQLPYLNSFGRQTNDMLLVPEEKQLKINIARINDQERELALERKLNKNYIPT